ncbi:MAG: hypothetical protein HQ525_01580 [Anaerolineae bacterium]|nr:hypothetical protein [Anaerolineae bacterium]
MTNDLNRLYLDANSALASKDYECAGELLQQILVADHDYKDAAQLLAKVIKLKRRHWYNDLRLLGTTGVLFLIVLVIYFFPNLQSLTSQPASAPVILLTDTPALTIAPPVTATATATLLPTPTSIPLTWKRISLGQDFERDTVTAFATDKNDPDVIYASMKNSGVYKTIDGGLSWRPAHQGLASAQVESLLIDSQNPRILYAGTMGGVFKTEDGGEAWYRVGEGNYLLMDLQDHSHIYARDEYGIYESTDQGLSWEMAYSLNKDCPGAIRTWAIHPGDGNSLFIAGGEDCDPGIYLSTDSGHSWKLIGMEGKPNIDTLAIGRDEQGNYSVYAQHYSPLGYILQGVYTSYNGGSSWSKSEGNFGCGILTSDPDNPSTIYCAGTSPTSLYITKGKGDPWRAIPGSYSKVYTAIHIDHPTGTNRLITGANDVSKTSDPNIGIFISGDSGVSWEQRNNGLGSTWAELKTDPLDSARIYLATYFFGTHAKTECRLYRSQGYGKNWQLIKWRGGDWCGPTFDSAYVLYLKEKGALQKSLNGGETWLWDSQDLSQEERRLYFQIFYNYALPSLEQGGAQSVSANPDTTGLIYDVGNIIYISTDAGYTWQQSAGSEGLCDARLFYKDQGQTVFAIGRYHQAYSTDSGVSWQNCGEDVSTSRSDSRLAVDLQRPRLYLATSGQGILISTDECQSWQPSNDGLSNLFVNTVAIDLNNSDTLYAGTDGGAYISFNGGQTWGEVSDGLLGATVVYSIAVDKDRYVYAATPYGIFQLENK